MGGASGVDPDRRNAEASGDFAQDVGGHRGRQAPCRADGGVSPGELPASRGALRPSGKRLERFFVCGDTLAFPGLKKPLSAPELRSTWANLRELGRLRSELAMLRRELDWVEVSPAVSGWLRRLGLRPSVEVAHRLM